MGGHERENSVVRRRNVLAPTVEKSRGRGSILAYEALDAWLLDDTF